MVAANIDDGDDGANEVEGSECRCETFESTAVCLSLPLLLMMVLTLSLYLQSLIHSIFFVEFCWISYFLCICTIAAISTIGRFFLV